MCKPLNILAAKASELEVLRKQLGEKSAKIQELKRQIEATKHLLKNKKKAPDQDQMEAFKTLSEKYSSMREEYNALLAEKSTKRET